MPHPSLSIRDTPAAPADDDHPPESRDLVTHPAIGRLCAKFTTSFMQGVTDVSGGDFIDGVIRMAILDANTRHVWADDSVNRGFAGVEEGLPDQLRRPVSIHSVATSLGLPYETVRRRIRSLTAAGMCSIVGRGAVITRAQLSDAAMRDLSMRTHTAVCELYADLRRLQPQFHPMGCAPPAPAVPSSPPVRLVARAGLAYVLRYLESAKVVAGSLLDGIIFLFILVANVEHVRNRLDPDVAPSEPVPLVDDARRRRVAVFALARSMGLVPETARRRVNVLVQNGPCVRDRDGVYVPAAVLLSPAIIAHRDRNLASVQRMFTDLRRAGVRLD